MPKIIIPVRVLGCRERKQKRTQKDEDEETELGNKLEPRGTRKPGLPPKSCQRTGQPRKHLLKMLKASLLASVPPRSGRRDHSN